MHVLYFFTINILYPISVYSLNSQLISFKLTKTYHVRKISFPSISSTISQQFENKDMEDRRRWLWLTRFHYWKGCQKVRLSRFFPVPPGKYLTAPQLDHDHFQLIIHQSFLNSTPHDISYRLHKIRKQKLIDTFYNNSNNNSLVQSQIPSLGFAS